MDFFTDYVENLIQQDPLEINYREVIQILGLLDLLLFSATAHQDKEIKNTINSIKEDQNNTKNNILIEKYLDLVTDFYLSKHFLLFDIAFKIKTLPRNLKISKEEKNELKAAETFYNRMHKAYISSAKNITSEDYCLILEWKEHRNHTKNERMQADFMVAIHFERIELIKRLIEKAVDINAKNNSGETPLAKATKRGRAETITLLVEKGAYQ